MVVQVYLSGHGGDGFLKFQDREELSAKDLGAAFATLWTARQYSQAMLIVDTCQAASMLQELSSPGIIGLASSAVGVRHVPSPEGLDWDAVALQFTSPARGRGERMGGTNF
jgi:glycosylphosphatidylinositol transamidase (GPIT) subunit GPI8